jgi:FixJ family two-component response regulator
MMLRSFVEDVACSLHDTSTGERRFQNKIETTTGTSAMEAMGVLAKGHEGLVTAHNTGSSVSPKATVAVIDDDESVRKSLVRTIQAAGYKVEAFASATEFVESIATQIASCVVSDLLMPEFNGLQLQEFLQSKISYLSIVFVTGHGDIPTSVCAMKAGAIDFLQKPISRSALLKAVGCAVERTSELRKGAAETAQMKIRYERLTPREREVFILVSAGLLNKQVAAQLGAAEKTVKQHRGSVMRKIEAESAADLILMAERLGVRPTNANFGQAKGKLSA